MHPRALQAVCAAGLAGVIGAAGALAAGCASNDAGFTGDASGVDDDGGARTTGNDGAPSGAAGDSGGGPSFGTDAALTIHDDFPSPVLVQVDGGGASVPAN